MNVQPATMPNETTAFIEIKLQDNKNKVRKATLYFDTADEWFPDHAGSDVPGFFAGAILDMMKIDKTVFLVQAKAFKIKAGIIQRWQDFAPFVKSDGILKPCFISQDGTIEII